MLAIVRQLFSDFNGLRRVCGNAFALRWLKQVVRHRRECVRTRNLQPADLTFGAGPISARFGDARAQLLGNGVVTGIREIWVRDCYLGGGFLALGGDQTVVDLGANIGTFTMLALAHGPGVRVIAVEPNRVAAQVLLEAARLNGFQDRLQICNAFIGGRTHVQDELAATADYAGSTFLTEQEFIERFDLKVIDFLKCDIEGSEYALLTPDSRLLEMTSQLSIELHRELGNPQRFIEMLGDYVFAVQVRRQSAQDCVVNARRVIVKLQGLPGA